MDYCEWYMFNIPNHKKNTHCTKQQHDIVSGNACAVGFIIIVFQLSVTWDKRPIHLMNLSTNNISYGRGPEPTAVWPGSLHRNISQGILWE